MKLSRLFFIAALLAASNVFATDISGFWKHTEEPGWIEINLDAGKGTVVRNDKFPERVGREILKDLVAEGSDTPRWKGQVFAEKLGEYKDANIVLSKPDLMTIQVRVGFISRTFHWQRVEKLPDN